MENGADLAPTQKTVKPETYTVEGAKIQLRWTETSPKESKNLDPKRGIVFIPAWNWLPEVKIVEDISQKVADNASQKVFTISSKTDRLGPDASPTEAKGMAQFIAQKGLSEVILVGHSEGGMKAADLAVELQNNYPKIRIDGLVLMDSMGLYDQDPEVLRKNFLGDPKVAKGEFESTGVTPPKGGTMQMLYGFWQDIKFFGVKYPRKLKEEISAMAAANPRLREIKAPVLIVTGDRDYASDHRKYVPQEEIDKRINVGLSDQSLRKQMIERGKARREYLKEEMFPNAENVAMIVISKGAHHAGTTDIRIDQAAYVASKIFERMRRPAKTASI